MRFRGYTISLWISDVSTVYAYFPILGVLEGNFWTFFKAGGFQVFLKKGDEVTVIYDKNRPTSFLIKENDLGAMLPLLCFTVGCVMIIIAVREFLSN